MSFIRFPQAAILVIGFSLAGCKDGGAGAEGRQPVFKVKGKITLSGGAVPNAMISFSPKGKQPVATGRTGTDGTYTLTTYDAGDGAAAGDYVVLVTKSLAAPASSAPAAAHNATGKGGPSGEAMHAAQGAAAAQGETGSALNEKYSRADQSDLKATVKSSGENVLDFDLKP
jgi:hypothetical protein